MGKLTDFSLSGYVGTQLAQPPTDRSIEIITKEILEAKRVGGEAILTIGKGLIEAKAKLSHGEWLPWLTEQVEFSERTAQNFMKLARNWSNPQTLADLGAAKALVILALPPEERESFISETHLVNGEEKTVIDMSVREVEKARREREEALADKSAAEAARDKMAEDMAAVKHLLKVAQDEKIEAEQALARARDEADRAAETVIAMEKQVSELKSRPVEVAVQVDQEAVEKARAEAVAEMQKKLDKAEKERDKLTVARDAAQDRAKAAEEALNDARIKLSDALKGQAPSPIASDAVLAQFGVYLEQAQEIANKMRGLLLKVRAREDGDTAGKLEKALRALGEKIGGAAQ